MGRDVVLKSWGEIDLDGFVHAGEHIKAIIHITCDYPNVFLSIATVQLRGDLIIDETYVNPGPLAKASALPRYGGSSGLHGGGMLFENLRHLSPTKNIFSVFSCPPTIIPIGGCLERNVDYSYEWVLRLPNRTPPTYIGRAASIVYKLTVGIKVKDHPDIVYEHDIHVLSSCSSAGALMMFSDIELPDTVRLLVDSSYVTQISPTDGRNESVLERYKRGNMPALDDFRQYSRHPLYDMIKYREGHHIVHSPFDMMETERQPVIFTLKSGPNEVAILRLNRDLLRIGEELVCSIKFLRGTVEVFQLCAEITCTESIKGEYQQPSAPTIHRQVFRRHEEACWLHRQLSFSISLPSDAHPTLLSNIINVTWALELILLCAPSQQDSPHLSVTPVQGEKNIIDCSVPLKIIPSLAINLATHAAKQVKTRAS